MNTKTRAFNLCLALALFLLAPFCLGGQTAPPSADARTAESQPQPPPGTNPPAAESAITETVQKEVDRAFEKTFAIINFILATLAILPIFLTVAAWALRNAIREQLAGQVRLEFQKDAEALSKSAQADLERRAKELLEQFIARLDHDMGAQLEKARSEFARQMSSIPIEKQHEKDRIIQRIRSIRTASVSNFSEVRSSKDISAEDRKEIGRLIADLDDLKSDFPDVLFSADDYMEQGNALYLAGRYEEALAAYSRSAELNPDNAETWYRKGEALRVMGRADEALNAYRQAIELDPQAPWGWLGSGFTFEETKRKGEAKAAYEKALELVDRKIRLEPDKERWWNLRGSALRDLGNQVQALEAFDRALQINPLYYEAIVNKAMSYRRLNDLDAAIDSCEQAIQLNASLPSAWYNKACYHSLKQQAGPALECLARAVGIAPICREWAQGDDDFESLRNIPKFRELVPGA